MSVPTDVTVVLQDTPIEVTVADTTITAIVDDSTPDVQILTYVGIPGPPGPTGSGGDLSQVFVQSVASATWVIPLSAAIVSAQKVPVPTVIDTGGTAINGFGWTHDAVANTLTLTFGAPFIGTAYLN